MTIKMIIPWLNLSHGAFNFALMILLFYQGRWGLAIRKARRAGAPGLLAAIKRHRKTGPILAGLGAAGFLTGMLIVTVFKGNFIEYPLHFLVGLAIVLCLGATYYISRRITIHSAALRTSHTVIGIMILCFYPIQSLVGLGNLL